MIAARMPPKKWLNARKPAAPELLVLSKGLPPPLLSPPDFCDCACPGEPLVLVLMLAVVLVPFVAAEVSTRMPLDEAGVCEVTIVVFTLEVPNLVVDGFIGTLVSVNRPVVTGTVDDRTMVLCPIDSVGPIVAGPPSACPVVVVTTATLHST